VGNNISHNFESSEYLLMESNCNDPPSSVKNDEDTTTQDQLFQMLSLISTQMMQNYQDLQDRIAQSELKVAANLQQLSQRNEDFRNEMRSEFLQFQAGHGSSSLQSSSPTSNMGVVFGNVSTAPSPVATPVTSTAGSPQDFQEQMMTLLTTTFSKLTTVLDSKTSDVKSDWPKFSGGMKKFKNWRLAILAQLSLSPWNELYDVSANTLLRTTTTTSLNEKLYAKLLLCLDGQVFQDMVSCKHVRANGLLLFHELSQTYQPSHVPEITAAKIAEFWGTLKRFPHESVDTYYNRFHSLLGDLEDAGEAIPPKTAIRQFISTLGSDFLQIQNNFRIGHLPESWKTEDWPSILVLCHDYANSVRPQGHTKIDPSSDFATDGSIDRTAHHKKIKQWFMNPTKYKAELEAEQLKYASKCVYHLTKNHQTPNCYIKKECEKLVANKKSNVPTPGSSTSASQGQLHHLTEEQVEEETFDDDVADSLLDQSCNDTNEEDLYYFARVSNHYLHLVKSTAPLVVPHHEMEYPIIADSGANFHMFKDLAFFTSLNPATGFVILGDGQTKLPIQGIGSIKCKIEDQDLVVHNVRFVPDLSESIYSLLQHIKQPQHGIHSSYETGLYIKFPTFQTKVIVGRDDIYLDAVPCSTNAVDCQFTYTPSQSTSTTFSQEDVCRMITNLQYH
jgi:hypothetical protein